MMTQLPDAHVGERFLFQFDPNNIEMQTVADHIPPGTFVPRQDRVDALASSRAIDCRASS